MSSETKNYQTGTQWGNVRKYLPVLFKQLPFTERIALFMYLASAACQRLSGIPFCKSRVFQFSGFKVFADSQGYSAMAMIFLGELLQDDPYRALDTSRFGRDTLVLDIGANAGFFTLIRCMRNPDLHVACFEPHPGTFRLLKRHMELNGLTDRVSIHNCAIGDSDGTLVMTSRKHSSMLTPARPESNERDINVEVKTIDSFKPEKSRTCAAAKIDVEGHEVQVLAGAEQTLAAMTSVVLEIHDDSAENACRGMLQNAGFACSIDGAIMMARRQA